MVERPRSREQCANGPRPCPWVGCKYHLYIDVNERIGSIRYNFPGTALEDIRDSCALDVAAEEGCTLDEVGAVMNLTRERIRQIEEMALEKLGEKDDLKKLTTDEGEPDA